MIERPFKCPVCMGRCEVEPGFYPGAPAERTCRSCKGTGIVWRVVA